MSTSVITPVSILETTLQGLASSSSNQSLQSIKTNQPTITNASTVNATSKIGTNTSGQSQAALTHDTVTLLNHVAKGNLSAVNTDLNKLSSDLKNQSASQTSSKINQDVTSLLKDLVGGNTTGAKTDLTKLKTDLQTQDQSTANTKSTSSLNVSPIATLLAKVQDQLNTGSVQGAMEDLAGYLVQNGQVTGSLLNVTA